MDRNELPIDEDEAGPSSFRSFPRDFSVERGERLNHFAMHWFLGFNDLKSKEAFEAKEGKYDKSGPELNFSFWLAAINVFWSLNTPRYTWLKL